MESSLEKKKMESILKKKIAVKTLHSTYYWTPLTNTHRLCAEFIIFNEESKEKVLRSTDNYLLRIEDDFLYLKGSLFTYKRMDNERSIERTVTQIFGQDPTWYVIVFTSSKFKNQSNAQEDLNAEWSLWEIRNSHSRKGEYQHGDTIFICKLLELRSQRKLTDDELETRKASCWLGSEETSEGRLPTSWVIFEFNKDKNLVVIQKYPKRLGDTTQLQKELGVYNIQKDTPPRFTLTQ
jgi:hypothetical protein